MAMFVAADGVGWLVCARIVQGLATGAAIGVLGAYLLDLQPSDGSRLGSLVNSVAPIFGFGFGAIVTRTTGGICPRSDAADLRHSHGTIRGTGPGNTGPARDHVTRAGGGGGLAARDCRSDAGEACVRGSCANHGVHLGVGRPDPLAGRFAARHGVRADQSRGRSVWLISLFPVSAAAFALLVRDLSPPAMARLGSVAGLAIGTGLFLLALGWSSITLFVIASIVAGAGLGSGFLGSIRAVSQLAEPHERAALLSAVYVVAYLAFSLPALLAGVITTHIGLRDTTFAYGGFVALVAAAAAALERLNHR